MSEEPVKVEESSPARAEEAARDHWTVLAEGHLSRRLFGSIRIDFGAAPAGRVVNRERHRMECLEVFRGDRCQQ